ncbi:MAG: thiamine pyrophosphate-requiring protein [Chloroflexota bacterium]
MQTLDSAQTTQDQTTAPLEVSDILVASMVANGVDTLFFSSGTDLIPYQEAISKARATGREAPRVITMLHEIVNLNTAIGYTMTSGKPAVTGVHVDAGTLNCGAGYHTVMRGNYPVVVTAGSAPTTLPGTMRGARDGYYFWYQELPDQAGIVRQFAKWDRKLELQDSPGFIMSRALQVAQTPPQGLSYLSLPREVLMAPARTADFPTVQELGIPRPIGLAAAQAREIADLLIRAEKPLVILGRSGRSPKTFRAMVELAELLALPVKNGEGPDAANFPSDHPLMATGPAIRDADVVLVIESGFPWVQGAAGPHRDATVITIGEEPIQDRIVTYEYPASQRYQADAYAAIRGLREAAEGRVTAADRARFAERLAACEAKKADQRRRLEENAQKVSSSSPISPVWLSYQLGKLANESSILVNDACTNAGHASSYFPIRQPGSYFRSGGSAGGWGLGASLGAKLGAPDREVILTVGEGYYLFGVSNVTFWAAARYKAPFLAVMYQNDSYSTGTSSIGRLYPDGYAISQCEFEGGMLHPAIDYVKEAEAAGAAAERVTDPAQVGPALQRGLDAVRSGTPALVAVQLPRLMCD